MLIITTRCARGRGVGEDVGVKVDAGTVTEGKTRVRVATVAGSGVGECTGRTGEQENKRDANKRMASRRMFFME
jgi:hypothetical protein